MLVPPNVTRASVAMMAVVALVANALRVMFAIRAEPVSVSLNAKALNVETMVVAAPVDHALPRAVASRGSVSARLSVRGVGVAMMAAAAPAGSAPMS